MKLFLPFRLFRYFLLEALPFIALTLLVLTVLILAQQITRQADLFFNSIASSALAFRLIAYLIPGILIISLPFSLLIGSLMALSRLSSDNELLVSRSSGIHLFKISQPFLFYGIAGLLISLTLTMQVIPHLISKAKDTRAQLLLAILAAPLKPQTFNTQFKDHLVYIQNIDSTTGDWIGVFIIKANSKDEYLVLTAHRGRLRMTQNAPLGLEISLSDGLLLTFSSSEPQKQSLTSFQQQEIRLSSDNPGISQAIDKAQGTQELSLQQLATQSKQANTLQERRQASIEWHKRLSLPFACLILVMLSIPLGISSSRQAGRSIAFAIGFSIAVLYYLLTVAGQNLAISGTLPTSVGVWLSNILGLAFAIIRHSSWVRNQQSANIQQSVRPLFKTLLNNSTPQGISSKRRPIFLSLTNYLLVSELIKYFFLASAILISTSLIFTLFDLLPSLTRSGLSGFYAGGYLLFLSPQIFYYTAPFAFLIATLVTHGVLSRSNQLTALLTSGLSFTRIITPILICATALVALLAWSSEQLLPITNREQDFRYNQIKGKRIEQSTLALGKHWIQGEEGTIYGFQLNSSNNNLLNTNAYTLDRQTGKLVKLLQVQKAIPINEQTWSIIQGWRYEISTQNQLQFHQFSPSDIGTSVNQLTVQEGIAIFRRIVNESAKMRFLELRNYIHYLTRLGANTSSLRVDLEKKLAFPFSIFPLLALALPLTLRSGRRGTLAGMGLSILIGFVFWITASFIEGLGRQSYLPPGLSIWGTQGLFLAVGIYLMFRLR